MKKNPEWKLKAPLYLTKKDKRYNKHLKQLKTRGFSDSETWSLYSNIAMFILPRLIQFRKIVRTHAYGGYPLGLTEQTWNDMLGEMIFAFDWSITSDEKSAKMTDEEVTAAWERYKKGMQLFGEWFRGLWW
jgi:hypothetical protein